ncbi:head-tail connector protein [Anianabacter salinae]|uniref:head-tail connector protein n=1 Tax=Anianabacter salinae TaxID=2851023 RepID=UPI002B21B829|nr:head-tail connector protein [Anianabacter salinae]
MLVEETSVPPGALPVAQFRDHLRLGSGFADDALQDDLLERHLRAALAAVEARTGKILIARGFVWTLAGWRDFGRQALPVAPIRSVTEVRLLDRHGAASVVDPSRYRLEPDGQRPRLVSAGLHLPLVPMGGSVEITFEAGYGASFDDLPPDLGQAVLTLAAHFYENRGSAPGEDGIPFTVSLLIDRYRTVRLFGEGGR